MLPITLLLQIKKVLHLAVSAGLLNLLEAGGWQPLESSADQKS